MALTAVAITHEVKTSSSTFYMYFNNVKDMMYALSQAVVDCMVAVRPVLDKPGPYGS